MTIALGNTIGPDFAGRLLRPDPPLRRTIHAFTRHEPDQLTASFIDHLREHATLMPTHVAQLLKLP